MPRSEELAERAVARTLSALSTEEIAAAIGGQGAVAALTKLVARGPSRRLGRALARFDASIVEHGLTVAAYEVLSSFGARLEIEGTVPATGAVLVVTNHPGAYDALAMMAATRRDDVALVAADRAFLRAMPHLAEHLVFVADPSPTDRGRVVDRLVGLRRALRWLEAGRVLVQYGAGAIEPDARFAKPGEHLLGAWVDGTSVLARRASSRGAAVVPAFVSGVHSARAKRLPIVRWAERRGITTIATLIQTTLPGFRDVTVTVRFGAPIPSDELASKRSHHERTSMMRAAVAALAPPINGAAPHGTR